jgi:hypothetical protein
MYTHTHIRVRTVIAKQHNGEVTASAQVSAQQHPGLGLGQLAGVAVLHQQQIQQSGQRAGASPQVAGVFAEQAQPSGLGPLHLRGQPAPLAGLPLQQPALASSSVAAVSTIFLFFILFFISLHLFCVCAFCVSA